MSLSPDDVYIRLTLANLLFEAIKRLPETSIREILQVYEEIQVSDSDLEIAASFSLVHNYTRIDFYCTRGPAVVRTHLWQTKKLEALRRMVLNYGSSQPYFEA